MKPIGTLSRCNAELDAYAAAIANKTFAKLQEPPVMLVNYDGARFMRITRTDGTQDL